MTVEVLSDVEEARLIHLGVSRGYPLYDRVACIVDIGGGSTEFIVADVDRPYFLHSVRLGSLRLYDEYLRGAQDAGAAYRKLVRHVRAVLEPVAAQLGEYRFDTTIGTSGTLMGLAALDAAATGAPLQRAHGYVLRLDRLRALRAQMVRMTPGERRKMPGMNPRRSDIIVAGAAIVIEALELLGREEIVVCERALRDGVVVDFLERNIAVARRLGDERMRRFDDAHELARRLGASGAHENHVAAVALALFDALVDVHHFEPADRDVLFAAALVHDVGVAVNRSAHHKHGAYIVRAAGLPHWRPEQVELIASLVRYHRKALPKATHIEWAGADAAQRQRILGLGALLRIADGLDTRHLGVVGEVAVERSNGALTIVAHAQQDIAPEIEAARFKADMFARAFGITPAIVAAASYAAIDYDDDASEAEIDAASISG